MNQSPSKVVILGDLRSSKNSKQIVKIKGRPSLIKSKAARDNEKEIMRQLQTMRNKQAWGKPEQFPIYVHFAMARSTHRIFDYVNISQLVLDCMTKCEYFPDDSMKYVIPVFHHYYKDKENPRTYIWWESHQ